MVYVLKNHVGGLKQIQQENKVVRTTIWEWRLHLLAMHFFWTSTLTTYLSFLQSPRLRIYSTWSQSPLYLRTPPLLGNTAMPLGRSTLTEMMKEVLEKAKLVTKYTNNSLRAYSITKLFQISVPDKLIMERSGHRVTEGLREYHRMNVLQELQVCTALDCALIQKKLRQPSCYCMAASCYSVYTRVQ